MAASYVSFMYNPFLTYMPVKWINYIEVESTNSGQELIVMAFDLIAKFCIYLKELDIPGWRKEQKQNNPSFIQLQITIYKTF